MTPTWRAELERVLKEHFKEQATVDAVVSMYSAIRTSYRIIAGKTDVETRSLVLQMLIDLTYALDTNPFMQRYKQTVWPVFQVSVNCYIDSLVYIDEDAGLEDTKITEKIELRHKAISCKNAIHELALICLMCEQGSGQYRSKSRKLRDQLCEIEDKIE
jgi:hypothetical protein